MAGRRWTQIEDDFLVENYPNQTAEWCSSRLQRTINAIQIRAKHLGIQAKGRCGCRQTREVIRILSERRVICLCPKHGETVHRLYKNGVLRCDGCISERETARRGTRAWTDHTRRLARLYRRKQRSTPLGKYVNRIRSALRQCAVGKISFSHDLPYTAGQLRDHLEDVRRRQNNSCPICGSSYDEVQDSIDHITPVSTAKTREGVLSLFDLSNLSLLCLRCNSSKGAKIYA